MTLDVSDKNLVGILRSRTEEYSPDLSQEDIVKRALAAPVASDRLSELSRGKNKIVIITSDHTRAVPSRITLPLLLDEIRSSNPSAEITILIATGLHRSPTEAEQRSMFGDNIVDNERIVVNNAFAPEEFVELSPLPSGASLQINRVALEADLLISEGFIEPHFFAGFSGGRKSILPGICSEVTVVQNHSYPAIAHHNAAAGILSGNPIHEDMVAAAHQAKLAFILNVALNGKKEIINAWAGDMEKAHELGTAFVNSLAGVTPVQADIIVTGNGGYPLDQNLYQSPKAVATAEACAGEDGVIIMFASCCDGIGGEHFGELMVSGPPEEIDRKLAQIPPQRNHS